MSAYWDSFRQCAFIPTPVLTEKNLPNQSGRVFIVTGGYAGRSDNSLDGAQLNVLTNTQALARSCARSSTSTMAPYTSPDARKAKPMLLLRKSSKLTRILTAA